LNTRIECLTANVEKFQELFERFTKNVNESNLQLGHPTDGRPTDKTSLGKQEGNLESTETNLGAQASSGSDKLGLERLEQRNINKKSNKKLN
jgi:hypothetical protein